MTHLVERAECDFLSQAVVSHVLEKDAGFIAKLKGKTRVTFSWVISGNDLMFVLFTS